MSDTTVVVTTFFQNRLAHRQINPMAELRQKLEPLVAQVFGVGVPALHSMGHTHTQTRTHKHKRTRTRTHTHTHMHMHTRTHTCTPLNRKRRRASTQRKGGARAARSSCQRVRIIMPVCANDSFMARRGAGHAPGQDGSHFRVVRPQVVPRYLLTHKSVGHVLAVREKSKERKRHTQTRAHAHTHTRTHTRAHTHVHTHTHTHTKAFEPTTFEPTFKPTFEPTFKPTFEPTFKPTFKPTTHAPCSSFSCRLCRRRLLSAASS